MDREIIRPYEICEFLLEETKLKTSIFDLKLDALVFEKMYIMFEKLEPSKRNLETEKTLMQSKKDEMLMTLDFKALTGESRPTIAMKEAIMQPKLKEHIEKITTLQKEVECYKNKLTIINDLIRNQRLMMKIESDLNDE